MLLQRRDASAPRLSRTAARLPKALDPNNRRAGSERGLGSVARRLIAVDGRAIFVVAVGQRPEPRHPHGGGGLQDAADYQTIGQHVVIIVAPLAGCSAR